MTGRFRYAQFDEAGRCTAIMSSAVDLGLPHRVDGDVRPEDIHLSQGEVRPCRAVTLSASRTILLCDGRDAISIDGLPEGAALLINGTIVQSRRVSSRAPGTLVVEAAGGCRSAPLLIEAGDLATFARRHVEHVDAEAEAALAAHSAPGAHRAALYRAKEAEARDYLATAVPSAPIPILEREAAARGVTRIELARAVVAKANAARDAIADIEALRVAAKLAIARAADLETIIAAAAVEWPDPLSEGANQ